MPLQPFCLCTCANVNNPKAQTCTCECICTAPREIIVCVNIARQSTFCVCMPAWLFSSVFALLARTEAGVNKFKERWIFMAPFLFACAVCTRPLCSSCKFPLFFCLSLDHLFVFRLCVTWWKSFVVYGKHSASCRYVSYLISTLCIWNHWRQLILFIGFLSRRQKRTGRPSGHSWAKVHSFYTLNFSTQNKNIYFFYL